MRNMTMGCGLNELQPGETGIVEEITEASNLRRRLQDLGLISGTSVTCVGRSPFGDPGAYLIRGTVVAVRDVDAMEVLIRKE